MTALLPMERDLLGETGVDRSARFSNGHRLDLRRRWGPGPIAAVIGHNPSAADASRDDPTCLWWMKWFYLFGFGGFIALNLYPFVTSSPAECRRLADWENNGPDWYARDAMLYINLPHLLERVAAADQVFVCWGAIATDHDWLQHVLDGISAEGGNPDLWCWGKNADGSPKHPMSRGKHRIPRDQSPILWRAAANG